MKHREKRPFGPGNFPVSLDEAKVRRSNVAERCRLLQNQLTEFKTNTRLSGEHKKSKGKIHFELRLAQAELTFLNGWIKQKNIENNAARSEESKRRLGRDSGKLLQSAIRELCRLKNKFGEEPQTTALLEAINSYLFVQ